MARAAHARLHPTESGLGMAGRDRGRLGRGLPSGEATAGVDRHRPGLAAHRLGQRHTSPPRVQVPHRDVNRSERMVVGTVAGAIEPGRGPAPRRRRWNQRLGRHPLSQLLTRGHQNGVATACQDVAEAEALHAIGILQVHQHDVH